MFLFKCCQEFNSGHGYEVKRYKDQKPASFVTNLKEYDKNQLSSGQVNVIKIKKSQYEEVYNSIKDTNKKFSDQLFPANQSSLGNIQGVSEAKWKRISDIIPNPTLFGESIQPSQVIQGSLGDCYFLSALAALAEKESHIRAIFGDQVYNSQGLYKVSMKVHGEIQQIIVDDYVPVNPLGQPIFCQPNRNEFWVLILEKAWAKIHGSYANIILGTPTEVLRCFTFAPADMFTVKQKLWNILSEYTKDQLPICCNTSEEIEKVGLSPGHSYTLLSTAFLEDTEGVHHKLLRLRDPWGKSLWEGSASEKDRTFWNKIVNNTDRKQFEKKLQTGNFGIFYITFNDFCQHFKQIHFCLLVKNANYISENLFCNRKNGRLYEIQINNKGLYSFELHQSQIEQLSDEQKKQEGICRSTLLLIKQNAKNDYDFIDGILKYNEEDIALTSVLEPGRYLVFAKIDPTRNKKLIPSKTIISVYSKYFTMIESTQQAKYPNLLKETFLKHARNHKKNKYNNGFMWLSSKLLFQQGGYAYIAFGNEAGSNKKFIIDLEEEQFKKMSFKLKGEFKRAGSQKIEVLPGEEKIFLARVNNQMIKSLKFPPTLGIKMEMIQG